MVLVAIRGLGTFTSRGPGMARMEKVAGSLDIHHEVTCFTHSSAERGAATPSHLEVRDCFSPPEESLKLTLCLIQTPAGAAASPPAAPSSPKTHFNLRLSS